ncbi:MAG: hypothetical protein CMB80_09275 [Flammeovirgaceae bacterium]|nr:hypothetical protein [Flammeovirgaceae bacterium]|tara:strand:+ start:3559 stop:3792 length:234 start_codon:yes stop_codon:yes gene_type:complete
MKTRVMIKGVTAIRKGRYFSQIVLSVGDFLTMKDKSEQIDTDDDGEPIYEKVQVPIENKDFDFLSGLEGKSVVISDD